MTEKERVDYITRKYFYAVNVIKYRFGEDLTDYKLSFVQMDGKKFANCNYEEKVINFFILGGEVFPPSCTAYQEQFINDAIIHELSHAIAFKYNLCSNLFCDHHNISFALTNYCLQREVFGKRLNFYRPYDLNEEFKIESIKINEKVMTKLVRSISFSSVKELADKSLKYAEYVRKNILKTPTYEESYW